MRAWQWIVDNRLRCYGEVDPNKLLVRINVAKHKREGEPLIDTLVHEELHIRFPRFGEARICALTEQKLRQISPRARSAGCIGSCAAPTREFEDGTPSVALG